MTQPNYRISSARAAMLLPAGMTVAVIVFLLVYGVELATFSVSIDEEKATFLPDSWRAWLAQGRWGMALLTWALPEFQAIPLLSTTLFGGGLLVATGCALRDLRLGPAQSIVFAVFLVGFPVWLHIAQFSTLAGGFGLGLAAASYGAGAVLRSQGWGEKILAVACLTFAIAVYQTLAIYAVCYLLFAMHADARHRSTSGTSPSRSDAFAIAAKAGASMAAAMVLYVIVQRAGLFVSNEDIAYVDGFLHLELIRNDPGGVAVQALAGLGRHLSGEHAIYLEWGWRVWLLAWLGLLPWAALRSAGRTKVLRAWSTMLAVTLLALMVIALPFFLSADHLPARAHVALPLLAAWLASRLVPEDRAGLPPLLWAAMAYVALVLASIGQSMFYADRVARGIDASLTSQLLPAIFSTLGEDADKPFRITLSGAWSPVDSPIRRAEVFGSSFYGHDGGNPARAALYMGFHGFDQVAWVRLASRPDLVTAAADMPNWPVEGSVQCVNGVVIIKFGEPTHQQLIDTSPEALLTSRSAAAQLPPREGDFAECRDIASAEGTGDN